MSKASRPGFQRPQARVLADRLAEPRRHLQVVAGARQVGKTTLVQQVLARAAIPAVYASADEPALRDAAWIAAQWDRARVALRGHPAGAVLALDEVQKVTGWSETVKRLWDEDTRAKHKLRVVLLASAPLLMQRGLTESLAGRFEVLHLPHWSYAEMRGAFGFSLDEYLYFGGYPGAAPLIEDPPRWRRYLLDSLIETTISRDCPAPDPRRQACRAQAAVRARLPLLRAGALLHQDARPAPGCRERHHARSLPGSPRRRGNADGPSEVCRQGGAPARIEPQAPGAQHGAHDRAIRAFPRGGPSRPGVPRAAGRVRGGRTSGECGGGRGLLAVLLARAQSRGGLRAAVGQGPGRDRGQERARAGCIARARRVLRGVQAAAHTARGGRWGAAGRVPGPAGRAVVETVSCNQ